jgi:hypothetical protein
MAWDTFWAIFSQSGHPATKLVASCASVSFDKVLNLTTVSHRVLIIVHNLWSTYVSNGFTYVCILMSM